MKKLIKISGMSCAHCVGHVATALKEICGVKNVDVNLAEQQAIVELAHEVDDNKIKAAIDEAGYQVVSIKQI